LIGQLAVDKAFARLGLGSALLRHALQRAVTAAKIIGGRVVVVRAIDAEAEIYWQSNGFIPMRDDPSMLFRSIQNIEEWLKTKPRPD
jgi:ribosomal protein S18 acetylase RimI-like enzyme